MNCTSSRLSGSPPWGRREVAEGRAQKVCLGRCHWDHIHTPPHTELQSCLVSFLEWVLPYPQPIPPLPLSIQAMAINRELTQVEKGQALLCFKMVTILLRERVFLSFRCLHSEDGPQSTLFFILPYSGFKGYELLSLLVSVPASLRGKFEGVK